MAVTAPEKTLEHWCSMYLTYRYRSKISLWWLATGDDISIANLPTLPGKALSLELKTSTPKPGRWSHLHEVIVDIDQLWEYSKRPKHQQPFYVFPWPTWTGQLKRAASRAGVPVTEIGYSRSGHDWWFALWMRVLTTQEVAHVMAAPLAAHGTRARGNKKTLVTINSQTGNATWQHGGATPAGLQKWRDFWTELNGCGRAAWPQTVFLPRSATVTPGVRLPHSQVFQLLAQEQERMRQSDAVENADSRRELGYLDLVPLVADAQGTYTTTERWKLAGQREEDPDDLAHTQVVYADARILK